MLAWAPVSTFAFESSGSFVFNDAKAQRDEGLRALLLVIVDAIQIYSLKYECLKVFCNLVDACPSITYGEENPSESTTYGQHMVLFKFQTYGILLKYIGPF